MLFFCEFGFKVKTSTIWPKKNFLTIETVETNAKKSLTNKLQAKKGRKSEACKIQCFWTVLHNFCLQKNICHLFADKSYQVVKTTVSVQTVVYPPPTLSGAGSGSNIFNDDPRPCLFLLVSPWFLWFFQSHIYWANLTWPRSIECGRLPCIAPWTKKL